MLIAEVVVVAQDRYETGAAASDRLEDVDDPFGGLFGVSVGVDEVAE